MSAVSDEAKTRRRESQRQYREKNRAKLRDRAAAYRETRRAELSEKQRNYHAENREARNEYSQGYAEENRERLLAQKREYSKANREKAKAYKRQRNYGVTQEQYEQMVAQSDGGCWICGGVNVSGRDLAVDHDHETGQVRGVLCSNCNSGIGKLGDSLAGVLRAAKYLRTERPNDMKEESR